MNKSLFQITRERQQLIESLLNTEGEVTEELQEELAINRDDFEEKSEIYYALIQKFNSEVLLAKAEIERYKKEIARREKAVDSLQNRLLWAVRLFGDQTQGKQHWKAQVGLLTLSTRQSPPSVEVLDKTKVPVEYLREVPATFEPDKAAISKALKEGKEVPGCALKEGEIKLKID